MKKLSILLFALLFIGKLFAQQINDPNAIKVDAKNFHAINVSNAFDVYLTQGKEEAVAVSASEQKFKDKIKVEVKDGVLNIRFENGLHFNSGKMKLKAYISFINIDKLVASGACDVFVLETLKADKLDINLSGATDLKGKLDIKDLSVDISGASDMKVSGNASNLNVEASGASDFKGYDFTTNDCTAKASGASSVQITVKETLNAHATGASDIHYKGEARIHEMKSSGASSISKS